jgi:hypothetical protein
MKTVGVIVSFDILRLQQGMLKVSLLLNYTDRIKLHTHTHTHTPTRMHVEKGYQNCQQMC